MFLAALLGFAFGFLGSMPIAGPIAALLFDRGLANRTRSGMYLAVGAAIPEAGYAYLAFWGFSEFLTPYPWIDPVSRGAAAAILVGLGLRFMLTRSSAQAPARPADPNVGNKRSFVLGFTIAALNPTLIATWTACITTIYSFGVVTFETSHALPFSVGVWSGIMSWSVVLLYLLGRFRARFSQTVVLRVLQGMGAVLVAIGFGFGVHFVRYFAQS